MLGIAIGRIARCENLAKCVDSSKTGFDLGTENRIGNVRPQGFIDFRWRVSRGSFLRLNIKDFFYFWRHQNHETARTTKREMLTGRIGVYVPERQESARVFGIKSGFVMHPDGSSTLH